MILANIGESIIDFGKQYGFNVWDWSAVIISLCSGIIAILSLIVTVKTLRSQKKTEQNTLPSINRDVQISLLAQNLSDLYDSYALIFALDYLLQSTDYCITPSSHFWELVKLNSSDVHEYLFYGSESQFRPIHKLKSAIDDFNNSLNSLESCLGSKNNAAKKMEITHIYDEVGYFIYLFECVLRDTFSFTPPEISTFLCNHFYARKFGKFTLRFAAKYQHSNDMTSISLPSITNSMAATLLNDKYENFFELSNAAAHYKSSKHSFIDALSKEVDLILLNTEYNGLQIHLTTDAPTQSNAHLTSSSTLPDNEWTSSNDGLAASQPVTQKNSWIFFLLSIN